MQTSRPCCWLKNRLGLNPTPSTIPNVSAGIVSGRGLAHPVTVDQTFTPDANGIVRWDLRFSSSSPLPFGSTSLGSWLALGADRARPAPAPAPNSTTTWVAYGAQQPFSPAGYLEPFHIRNFSWSYGVRNGGTNTFGIPLAMLAQDAATVSLALSANDTIVDLDLNTMESSQTGALVGFGRLRHRIGGGVTMQSTQYITVAHSGSSDTLSDWRSLLGWYVL